VRLISEHVTLAISTFENSNWPKGENIEFA